MFSEQKKNAVLTILTSVENKTMTKDDALGVILAITEDDTKERVLTGEGFVTDSTCGGNVYKMKTEGDLILS